MESPEPEESSSLEIVVRGQPVRLRKGRHDEFWRAFERGVWEPETRATFQRFLDAEHSYIDVGAWIGPTLLIGCQFAKRAYGLEPDPIAHAELVDNLVQNRPLTRNVEVFPWCLAPASGPVAFGSRAGGGDSMSSLLFPAGKTSWIVEGVTIEEFLARAKIHDCNFIKMDIEGGEYSVVPAMLPYLRGQRPTLLLSLHPCFLGNLDARGYVDRLARSVLRFETTVHLLRILSFYPYFYDPYGKCPEFLQNARHSRIHRFLAETSWKPVAWLRRYRLLARTCWRGARGKLSTLVLTSQEW